MGLFGSLRGKLIAAFAAVILLSLVLTSGAFLYLVREYGVNQEKARLEGVLRSAAVALFQAARANATRAEIEEQMAQIAAENNARILLLTEHGQVVRDTDSDRLLGRQFPLPPSPGPGFRPGGDVIQARLEGVSGEPLFAIVTGGPLGQLRVSVVAADRTLAAAGTELLPRLLGVAVASLFLSAGLAFWLASSITRPIVQITRVSEQMARGQYDQQVRVPTTGDEVARLAQAFNLMATEVARSHCAMRDLLANVSHDLRTPLTSVQGFSTALVDGTLADRDGAREAGRVIGEEAERMRSLVEDLLDLGRIQSGQADLEKRPVDLADLVRSAERRFALRQDDSGVALDVDLSGPVVVSGDPLRLAQVLDNLLDNAFKHTPPGGTASASVRAESGSARLAVTSRGGPPIPPDEQERIFERFYQLDRARAASSGRGLGLAIVREIVQAHGGTILARSSEEGTIFEMLLPLIGGPEATSVSSRRLPGRRAVIAAPRS